MRINFMHTLLIIVFLFLNTGSVIANEIDSLKTKQDVQRFLSDKLGETGIILVRDFAEIAKDERIRMFLSEPDSVEVVDPVTHELVTVVVDRDSIDLGFFDTFRNMKNIVYDRVTEEMMNQYPYHFYKADIDGNGKTDLVIDAGCLIVVMDTKGKYEGYMFAQHSALGFRKFVSLPDGPVGLVTQHDHNLCWGSSIQQNDIEITDTTIDSTVSPGIVKVEHLGSFGITARTGPQCNKTDTIVYRYGGFAKYNSEFAPGNISKISYQYTVSGGTTADYTICMEINKDGRCYLRYPKLDVFQRVRYDRCLYAKLDSIRLGELFNYTSYINVKSKKDSYCEPINHASGGRIVVYFVDGNVKKISFWGAWSTPLDLMYLSKNISVISNSLHWQEPSKKPNDFVCPQELDCRGSSPGNCECVW
ncbi:MAG TPA: hypothetical protein VIN07_14210 [Flavipsychrobacter sp.]